MGRFIAGRLLQFPLVLAIIYLVTFFLVWVAPGDPFTRTDKNVDPSVIEAAKERLHAQHWYTFLGYYPVLMLKGDLGPSLTYEEWSVNKIIGDALPISITLGIFALLLAVIFGVGIGAMAAVRRGGVFDWFSLTVALVGISLPSFVTAAVLFAVFSVRYRIFPIGEWGSLRDLWLPGIALAMAPLAYIARLTARGDDRCAQRRLHSNGPRQRVFPDRRSSGSMPSRTHFFRCSAIWARRPPPR